jgi:IS30 family transposase
MNTKYSHLTLIEREEISKGIYAFETFTQIALRLNRHTSTITREVWAQVKVKKWCYSAVKGEKLSKEKKNKSGRKKKLDLNMPLLHYVQGKLREDWSPEEIAKRIKIDYPKDNSMRISHETIYQYLYCLPKGELKKELMKSLRRERKRRLSRGSINSRRKRIEDIVSIEERPKEAEGRMIPGHWEGDLIVGKNHASAIGTLVERTTRLTIIVPLKEKTAFAVANAFTKAFKRIPKKLKKTLTYDRGSEMSLHRLFTDESNVKVFFADPYSPWQRGTNENTNGLIRQYFPKSTDFREVSIAELKEAERRLNSRPRKVLNYYTPAEKFYELITKKKVAIDS